MGENSLEEGGCLPIFSQHGIDHLEEILFIDKARDMKEILQ